MKVYKTRWFSKWMKKENVAEKNLLNAVDEMRNGFIDADLGEGICKKRIALPGRGKRGGARTIVAYNKGDVIFFIYGFAKNEKENIHEKEFQTLRVVGLDLLSYTEKQLNTLLREKELEVIVYE